MRTVRRAFLLAATTLATACTVQNPPPTVTSQPPAEATAAPARLAPQPFTPPRWAVGDSWQYSDGYGMRVVEVTGDAAKFQRLDDPGQWFVMRGLFREQTKSRAALRNVVFRSEDPMALFSAPAGQPIVYMREYTRNGVTVRHRTSWAVEGRESITVPAGTFDTIVLTMRTRSVTGNWLGYERWWYSPAIRNYVRLEFKYGEAPQSSRVLVSHTVK